MRKSTQNEGPKRQTQGDWFEEPTKKEVEKFELDYGNCNKGFEESFAFALSCFIANRRKKHENRVKELEAEVARLKAAPFTDEQLEKVREAVKKYVSGRPLGLVPFEHISNGVISRLRPAPKTLEERVTIHEPNDEGYPYVVRFDGAYRKEFFDKEDAEIYRLGLIATKIKDGSHA